ncbi:MAG: TetR/AcrR family transcriptional regulator [Pseudomonas sp.]
MRYSPTHKEQTRQKLLESSGALAKRGGFNATGVAGLMKAIGLTGGAFYNHFPSKDDLFTEVVRRELSHSPIAQQPMTRQRLERCLDQYLSLAHVHNPEGGCAIPALGAEIAQGPLPVREEAEHWLRTLQQTWAETLQDPALAWALISQCVGALVIARMLATEDSQQEVLSASRAFINEAVHARR